MKEIFMPFLNVSINGSILIAAVILTRFIFKKYNRSIICILWGLVALRMLIPVNIPLEISLLPVAESVTAENVVADVPITDIQPHKAPIIDSGINVGGDKGTPDTDANSGGDTDTDINVGGNNGAPVTDGGKDGEELPPVSVTPGVSVPVAPPASNTVTSDAVDTDTSLKTEVKDIIVRYGSIVWLVGMACMVIYLTASDVRLRLKTRVRYEKEKGVFLCDDVKSPFVMGVIRPQIILPSSTDGDNEHYILMHEKAHIERGDHIWKVLAFAVLAVHWYNPLVWLSFMLYSRDTEMACDERVLKKNGTEIRKAYAHALLTYSTRRETTGGWSFSQRSLATRIKGVLNYKKPALWVFVSFGLACIVLVVCFMTVPVEGEDGDGNDIHVSATEGTSETESTESTEPTENTEMTENTEPTENPEPTESEPTEPEPTEPEPTEPEPTEPEPTEPEPTEPGLTYPSTVFSLSARSDNLDGEALYLPVTSFQRNVSFFYERMSFIDAPIMGAIVEGVTMEMGVTVATSLDELHYNLQETDNSTSASENLLINSSQFEKYDGRYFEENAVIIIVDSLGSGICKHSIIGSSYRDGELNLNLKKRSSEPGVPETGDITRWISIIEIPKTKLESVITISFYVERMEPHTEYMY